jgi:hypothetical protein
VKITKDSHLDHGLTGAQIAHLLKLFADRTAFFIETVTLPEGLGTVPCGLFGPVMGDPPVDERRVEMVARGSRAYPSRVFRQGCVETQRQRSVRTLTVIAGPHEGEACILYTAFGGPIAPKELADPTIKEQDLPASREFWAQHALVNP